MAVQTSAPGSRSTLTEKRGEKALDAIAEATGKKNLITSYLVRLKQIQSELQETARNTQRIIDSPVFPRASSPRAQAAADVDYEHIFPFERNHSSNP